MVRHMDYVCSVGVNGFFGCDKRKDGFNADLKDRAHTLSNWLYMLIGSNWCPRGFPWLVVDAFFSFLLPPQAAKCTLNLVGRLRSFCLANHFCLQKYDGRSGSRSPAPSLPSPTVPISPLLLSSSARMRRKEKVLRVFFSSLSFFLSVFDSINSHKKVQSALDLRS